MYRTLIIILFLFFGKTVSATNHNTGYSFTQLSIQQGLSQPTVQSILLDERGTLWIGTKNGLNIYTQEGLKRIFIIQKTHILCPATISIILPRTLSATFG